MNVSIVSPIRSPKIPSVNCPFYMNKLLLQKVCYIVFDEFFCIFFILSCLGGLNVVELLVIHLQTKSKLFNQVKFMLAQYLVKRSNNLYNKREFLVDKVDKLSST